MKKIITILFWFTSLSSFATNYYVSNTGNDALAGTSQGAAWQTIAKVNSFTFVANDSILFKRGDSFFGSLIPNRSNLVFGAYGTGDLPIITGFVTPSSWTLVSAGIYKTNIPTGTNRMNSVAINGTTYPMGRTPNQGSFYTISGSSGNTITYSGFSGFPPYVGGEIVSIPESYVCVRSRITAQTGGTLTYTPITSAGNEPVRGKQFFVQGAVGCLDQFSEWAFDATNKDLYVHFGASTPASYTVQAGTIDTLLNLGGDNGRASRSNITVTDLNFQGANFYAVQNYQGSNNIVKNCTFLNNAFGIMFRTCITPTIDNNQFINTGGSAIQYAYTTPSTGTINITNNNIRRSGWFLGMANNGLDVVGYSGINTDGGHGTINITYNRIDSTGYCGTWSAYPLNLKVKYNYVTNFCDKLIDGGGIYMWSASTPASYTGIEVQNNIVTKPLGVNGGNFKLVCMIYFDDATSGATVTGNTCFNSTLGSLNVPAIFGNSNANMVVRDNTFFNVQYGYFFSRMTGQGQITGNRFRKNVVYADKTAVTPANLMMAGGEDAAGATQQATYRANLIQTDSNYYRDQESGFPNPFWGYGSGTSYPYQNVPSMNLATWRTYINGEANSVALPTTTPDFQFNATKVATTYSFSGLSKKDAQGNVYNNSAVLQPFTSKIFFPNGTATGGSLAASATQSQISCFGGSSTVTITATGGTSPYTGTGTFSVTVGTYNYKVKDAVNDSVTVTVTVTQPPLLAVASSRTNVLCFGGTGTITTLVTGGTLPVTHKWSSGATTANLTPIAGTYTDTVTDARGCKVNTGAITITQPAAALTAGTPTAPAIVSNGGTTTITVPSTTGGTPPYSYSLNGALEQTSNVFSNVPAGVYVITITDNNACNITKNITITQPNIFTSSASATTISCNGDSSTVTVTASGGTAPYTGTGTFKRVAGTYVFTVTDNLGNTSAANVTITQPSKLVASATATTISIFGGLSTVVISSTGGTGAVTGTGTFSVPAGIYTYTVTDANNCKSSVIVSLSNPVVVAPQFLQTNIIFRNGN